MDDTREGEGDNGEHHLEDDQWFAQVLLDLSQGPL